MIIMIMLIMILLSLLLPLLLLVIIMMIMIKLLSTMLFRLSTNSLGRPDGPGRRERDITYHESYNT